MTLIECPECGRKWPDFMYGEGEKVCKGCREKVMSSRGGVAPADEPELPPWMEDGTVQQEDKPEEVDVDSMKKTDLAVQVGEILRGAGWPVNYEDGSNQINVVGNERTFRLTVSIPRR